MARHVNHSQGGILRCRPPTYLTPGFRQVSPVCRQIQPAALEDIHGERGSGKGCPVQLARLGNSTATMPSQSLQANICRGIRLDPSPRTLQLLPKASAQITITVFSAHKTLEEEEIFF